MPLALMEAMASGVPVVASGVGGVPDLVEVGRTGTLVEPGNADDLTHGLLELLADPTLRRTMGRAARQRAVLNFSIENSVETMAQLLLRLGLPRNAERRISAVDSVKPTAVGTESARGDIGARRPSKAR
jgi:glycosyltransferase involved in cell wall biosynthesis